MAKARVCDRCGTLMAGKRNIVRVLEIEEGAEPRDTKTIYTYDIDDKCVQDLRSFIHGSENPIQTREVS